MTHIIKGHTVLCCHITPQVTFAFRSKVVRAGPDIVEGFVFIGGRCQGFHFQLTPN
jgi:hypothetical protein